jgi:uncharacterized protein (TIRG00374 family)
MADTTPAGNERMKMRLKSISRVLVSAALLFAVFFFVDLDGLFERIAGLDPMWVGIALLTTLPQYFLSAARWRLTAERLGANLPFHVALSEYYLAVLTNQVLPGGVLGDAARAVRHGHRLITHDAPLRYGPVIRAVIFERASGQLILLLFMLAGLFFWPAVPQGQTLSMEIGGTALFFALIVGVLLFILIKGPFRHSRFGIAVLGFFEQARYVLLARDVVFLQGLYSLSVLATYLFCFYCAARAIGIAMSFSEVVALVPVILLSMTIPITIAGWGIREASAAAIWGLANLTPTDGVAISVTYGIIILLSAMPGIFFVFPRLGQKDIGDNR